MKHLYRNSLREAKSTDRVQLWKDRLCENIRCRDFLDKVVAERFDGYNLPSECVQQTVKEFGFDRTMWIIANTIEQLSGDGRICRDNRTWAKSFNIPKSERNSEFALNCHSCLVDGLAGQVQKMYSELGLFSVKHIVRSDEPQDYTGKLLILRDTALKEEFRTPEDQLFLAENGFGCSPTASGRKVFGRFLSDGEQAQFNRTDFLGIIDEQYIPEWAAQKLSELSEKQTHEPQLNM